MASLAGSLLLHALLLAAPPPPSLATAAELLAERGLAKACVSVTKLGLAATDATDADLVRLHLVSAIQRLKEGDAAAAQKAMGEALKLDRAAQLPAFASSDARDLLEDVRARLPAKPRPPGPKTRAASGPSEAPAHALARAFDTLYLGTQLDGAGLVLDLAERSQPFAREDQAQIAIRRGILLMDLGEEVRAERSFQQAHELDPKAKPPDYIPPNSLRAFDDVRRKDTLLDESGDRPLTKKGKSGAPPTTSSDSFHLEPVGTTMMISGGVVAIVGGIVFIANSQPTSPPPGNTIPLNTGQIAGGVMGVVGIAAVVGGYIVSQRPELVSVRLEVSPSDRSGLLVATGHF